MRRFLASIAAMLVLATLAALPGGHADAQTPTQTPTPTSVMPAAPGFISGSIPAGGGFGLAVFSGGTYDDLVRASGCPVARVAFWVTSGGQFLVYVPASAVAAPNAAFEAAFPSRTISSLTVLIGRCTPATASGVQGRVTLGPLCGPQNALLPCPDRPYVATLLFLDLTGREVARLASGEDGRYAIALAAGSYTLVPLSPSSASLPRAASQRFEVLPGQVTAVDIAYDSGIRSVQQAP